jgi:hypothetical protein
MHRESIHKISNTKMTGRLNNLDKYGGKRTHGNSFHERNNVGLDTLFAIGFRDGRAESDTITKDAVKSSWNIGGSQYVYTMVYVHNFCLVNPPKPTPYHPTKMIARRVCTHLHYNFACN